MVFFLQTESLRSHNQSAFVKVIKKKKKFIDHRMVAFKFVISPGNDHKTSTPLSRTYNILDKSCNNRAITYLLTVILSGLSVNVQRLAGT